MARTSRFASKNASFTLPCLLFIVSTNLAHAEWNYGIGTGLFRMNAEGDQGLNTQIAGPVVFDVDLDPDDFDDLMESAFGFGGYATNGTWMIQYSLANLQLEGGASRAIGATTADARLGFDVSGGEVTFGYPIKQSSSVVLRVFGGVRYLKHELSSDIRVGALLVNRSIDLDWTDALVGISADVPLNDKWTWSSRFDVSAGDSEGTSLINTGLTWSFVERWTATFFAQNQALDLENGSIGDSDWYLYDADEFGWGITFLRHW